MHPLPINRRLMKIKRFKKKNYKINKKKILTAHTRTSVMKLLYLLTFGL